jgi:hypothetical protein
MLSVKDMVKDGKKARFSHYAKGELWYATEEGFLFPIPVADTGDGSFGREEKAMLLMRWIRKQVELVEQEKVAMESQAA